MACARRGDSWLRAVGRILRRPETFLLAVLGLGLMVAGVVLDESALVVSVGPGLLSLAVLLSLVREFKFGIFFAKFREEAREIGFEEYMELQEESLRRLAAELGAGRRSRVFVKDALVGSHEHWEQGEAVFRHHVICLIVHRVLGVDRQGDRYREALHVLVGRGFDTGAIAGFLDVPVERVTKDMADAR